MAHVKIRSEASMEKDASTSEQGCGVLSPGCTSFDEYASVEERGDVSVKYVDQETISYMIELLRRPQTSLANCSDKWLARRRGGGADCRDLEEVWEGDGVEAVGSKQARRCGGRAMLGGEWWQAPETSLGGSLWQHQLCSWLMRAAPISSPTC